MTNFIEKHKTPLAYMGALWLALIIISITIVIAILATLKFGRQT